MVTGRGEWLYTTREVRLDAGRNVQRAVRRWHSSLGTDLVVGRAWNQGISEVPSSLSHPVIGSSLLGLCPLKLTSSQSFSVLPNTEVPLPGLTRKFAGSNK